MGAAGLGAAAGAATGLAGAIIKGTATPRMVEYPDVTAPEQRYRKRTQQLMSEGRDAMEQGVGLNAELLGPMLRELGYDFDMVDNRGMLGEAQSTLDALRADVLKLQRKLVGTARKRRVLNALIARDRSSKDGGGLFDGVLGQWNGANSVAGKKKGGKLTLDERKQMAELNKFFKEYQPQIRALGNLREQVSVEEANVGQLRTSPYTIRNVRRSAPTFQESANVQIQDRMTQRVLDALDGKLPDDPRLMRELDKQERVLQEQLRRRLGTGFEESSAGAEAMANARQRHAETVADWNRREYTQGRQLQLQGQEFLENYAQNRRNAATALGLQRANAGQSLAALGLGNVQAQTPYQFDRNLMFQTSLANLQVPTQQQQLGDMLGQIGGALGQASGGGFGGFGGAGGAA